MNEDQVQAIIGVIKARIRLLERWADNQSDEVHDYAGDIDVLEDKRLLITEFDDRLRAICEDYELKEQFGED